MFFQRKHAPLYVISCEQYFENRPFFCLQAWSSSLEPQRVEPFHACDKQPVAPKTDPAGSMSKRMVEIATERRLHLGALPLRWLATQLSLPCLDA